MFLHGSLARVAVARVDGAPTLAPLGWLSGTDGGCAWVDRGAKASGGASLRLEPAGGRTSVRAALPVRVRPGYTYAVGAALAVTPDYDRPAGLPAVVFRAGDAEQRVCLTSDVEPGQFAALTQTLTVPEAVEELGVEIEAFGGRGAAWVDDVCLSPEPQWEALARGRTPPGTVAPGVEWREAELPDGTNGEPAPVPRRVLEGEAAGGAAVCLDLPDSRWAGLWWRFEVRPQTAYAVWVRCRTEAPAAGFDDLFVCDSAGQPLPGTGRMRIPIDSGGVGYRWFRAGFLTGELSEVRVYLENEWNAIAATPSALWDALVLEEQD
jgi:hypothetical protein